ncbi:PTS system sucrose-specific IIC component [Lactobacillus colini]|uniref:PTS system sucrose-specific IIC component n=1 Tax=Lactobacillus colini TaxID=1819254 RepID=A0ABS4ME72_9LACO|nr:PTS transporter subunit EIIC [Lactobacillus colini]MBP2057944.1 PTS system sucrose-specific IIC component [Lactobacillus colini]
MNKEEKSFAEITKAVVPAIGGKENAVEAFHCATRLRINLKDLSKVKTEDLADLPLVKGVNLNTASKQLQLIIGPGLVDRATEYFIDHSGIPGQASAATEASGRSEGAKEAQKRNLFQGFLDDLTGVFTEVLPAILAGGILIGLNNLLTQRIFGPESLTKMFPGISGISQIISIGAGGIFAMLPLIIAYSATKRYGGRPVLGLAIGTVMMSQSLPSMSDVATKAAKPLIANVFGWHVSMNSFGGQIIVALIMGWLVAKLDNYLQKHLPGVIQFVLAPMLTILISSFALFLVVGPIGVTLSNWITTGLLWVANTLGIFGYAAFSGVQQLIVITGLHNMFGAVETQLIATTKYDFLNPLMSVALMGQGGGVIAYFILNRKNKKAKEISISAFFSILFGISEPAIFGINLVKKYPLIGGCIGGAIAGAYVYLTKLTAVAFGTTGLTGIAIAAPQNNGYINYFIANLIGLVFGCVFSLVMAKFINPDKK